jgi:hypothetical protein
MPSGRKCEDAMNTTNQPPLTDEQKRQIMGANLMQGAAQPQQGQMHGGVYVAPSATQGLARALQMYAGHKMTQPTSPGVDVFGGFGGNAYQDAGNQWFNGMLR